MMEQLLSKWPEAQSGISLLFLFGFIISALMLGNNRRMFIAMLRSLFREQDRESLQFEIVHGEFICKLILCLQAMLLTAVLAYCVLCHEMNLPFETIERFLYLLGGTAFFLLIFLIYKFLTYLWLGYTFFLDEDRRFWNTQYFAIVSLSGIALFLPAALTFYWTEAYYGCLAIALLYFLFVKILICYKIYVIFFQQKSPLYYFILYLCAQELLPLFLLSETLVYFYGT
jgi:hypothetical protein